MKPPITNTLRKNEKSRRERNTTAVSPANNDKVMIPACEMIAKPSLKAIAI